MSRRDVLKAGAALGVTLAGGGALSACGSKVESSGSAGAAKATYRWRTGTNVPADASLTVNANKFADLVREKTGGAVDIKVFPNAQLGADPEYFKGLENGSMPIAFVTTSVIASTVPEAMLFNLPYVFKSAASAHTAINGPANQKQTDALEARGIHVLGWINGGSRSIGGKKAYATPADMERVKIRVIQSPLFIELFKAYGAIPTPLPPTDVFSALQQGVVTAYDQQLPIIVQNKWYEPGGHVSVTQHVYTIQMLGVNKKLWDSLPQDIQSALTAAAKENTAEFDASQEQIDREAIDALRKVGVDVTEPDLGPWREASQKIYPKFAKDVGGMSEIENLIASQ
jgi:tripartite ATP-independent transporter DctP family solute receptor